MDPVSALGVVSSVIAIWQLTGAVVSQGYSYIGALKDAPKELKALVHELTSLYGVLSILKGQLEIAQATPGNNPSSALELLDQPGGPLKSCDDILKRVQKRLGKLAGTPKLGDYLVGPFKDKEIKRDIERLERLKSVFQLALGADQMRLSRAIDDYLRKTLDESQKEQQIIGKHVRNTDSNVEELRRESNLRAVGEGIFQDHVRKTLDKSLSEQQVLGKHARNADDNLEQLCRDTKRRLSEEAEIRKKEELKKRRDDILGWLSRIDHQLNHHAACALQQPGTGAWFTEGQDFKGWQDKAGSVLWLHGIPGAGKTILTSTIIQKVMSTYGDSASTAVAYFYFDFKDREKQKTIGMLRSLLFQLFKSCDTISDEVNALYEKHKMHLCPPVEELQRLLKAVSGCFTRCFVVLDALDECDEREILLPTLTQLTETGNLQNTSFLFTSRKEHDIETAFSKDWIQTISIQDDKVATDVGLYVSKSIEGDEKLKKLGESLKKDIISALVRGAKGMFRWVKCQIDTIRDSRTPNAIRKALVSLPQSLDDTYDRILLNIKSEADKELIRRTLQWVVFAARPMTLEEVAEAVVIEEGEERLDKGARLNEPSSLLSICGSLFSLDGNELGLAHYSVQEYLKSERIRRGPASQFAMQEISASIEISKICLTYIGFALYPGYSKEESDPDEEGAFGFQNGVEPFPLLTYAATNWLRHAKPEVVQEGILEPFEKLCSIKSAPKTRSLTDVLRQNATGCRLDWLFHAPDRALGFDRHRKYDLDPEYNIPSLLLPVQWDLFSLAQHLLSGGADPNEKLPDGCYFLGLAAKNGHKRTVEILLQFGADANRGGWLNSTALRAASSGGHEEVVKVLLQHGAHVNAQDSEYRTALQAAIQMENEKVVEILLQHGADVNAQAQGGEYGTALQAASYWGNEKVVEILLQYGADVNAQGGKYGTALQAAIRMENEKVVEILLQHGADVNAQAQGGKYGTALQAASYWGNEKVVGILLQHGADVNSLAQGGMYETALQAASCQGNEKAVEILLQHGADVNARDSRYRTALYRASRSENEKVVEILLQHGADVNAQGGEYGTTLQAASYWGNEKVVEILLQYGADVNAQGGKYGMALQAAIRMGNERVVEILLQHGADVNAQAQGGMYETALQAAIQMEDEKVVEILLQHGADVNAQAQGGEYGTTLQAASYWGNEKVVEILLQYGADVNAQTQGGMCGMALQAAIRMGNERVVEILLQHGADVNAQAQGGMYETALQAASYWGNEKVVEILLQHGADVNAQAQGSIYETALQAASYKGDERVVKILLQHGADVNAQGGKYGMALQAASCQGSRWVVEILLQHGAHVDAQGGKYGTALQAASYWGNEEVVEILLQHGADVNAQAQGGEYGTALQAASYQENKKVVEILLQHGADVNAQDGGYGTALQAASHSKNEEVIRILSQHGAYRTI